jgi:probable F420-dependent oxidoreductase
VRPFRFLASPSPDITGGRALAEAARRAEAIGYSALVLADHLVAHHAPVPVLATIAAATERLRIGTFVLNVDLRHPAVLAQDLASLDVLSGGRLEIGIGAGWNRPEYDAIGLAFDPVGTRVDRLGEAITVLKGCFADSPFSFAGHHYTITDHDGLPKPAQRPHPPLFVGGGGRRLLTLAGRVADIVGLAPRLMPGDQTRPAADPRSLTLAAAREKISWVQAAAGARFDEIEINAYPSGAPIIVTHQPRRVAEERIEELRRRSGIALSVEELLESPHIYIGTVASLAQKLTDLRERLGITSFLLGDVGSDADRELEPIVEALAGR